MCGGIISDNIITNFLLILTVNLVWKLVNEIVNGYDGEVADPCIARKTPVLHVRCFSALSSGLTTLTPPPPVIRPPNAAADHQFNKFYTAYNVDTEAQKCLTMVDIPTNSWVDTNLGIKELTKMKQWKITSDWQSLIINKDSKYQKNVILSN